MFYLTSCQNQVLFAFFLLGVLADDDIVDQSVRLCLLGRHVVIALGIGSNHIVRLAGVGSENLI